MDELHLVLDNILKRLEQNLKKRKYVGQRTLVSNIRYESKLQNLDFEVKFIFELKEQKTFFDKSNKVFKIKDPLFGENKVFSRQPEKIAFVRNANIYKNLEEKYFYEIVEKVAEIDANIAVKLFIEAI